MHPSKCRSLRSCRVVEAQPGRLWVQLHGRGRSVFPDPTGNPLGEVLKVLQVPPSGETNAAGVALEGSPSAVSLVNTCPGCANDSGGDALRLFDERHLQYRSGNGVGSILLSS